MIFTESETVELKSVYADSIKKEIVAFANTHGGTIYIGVEDDGEVCGIDHTDLVTQQVVNAARILGAESLFAKTFGFPLL